MENTARNSMTERPLGELIQAYARAKWVDAPNAQEVARLGGRLDPPLRDRIDALGFEGEGLLEVEATDVLSKLEALERESAEEDAAAVKAAGAVRAREERAFSGEAADHWRARPAGARSGGRSPAKHDSTGKSRGGAGKKRGSAGGNRGTGRG